MAGERERQDMEDVANNIKQHGVAGVSGHLRKKLDSWKEIPLNIGVIGSSGVGKSTFINTIRHLEPTDPGAAETDVVQSTMEPTSYEYPENPGTKLWDLPGVNTPDFPRETYLTRIQFQRYDFFVIICSERFTLDDVWFAQEVQQADKLFYFVRTKMDIAVRNDREDYKGRNSEEAVLSKIRGNCTAGLSRAGFTNPFVFLLCKNFLLYDFPALEEKLIFDLPELKKEAALLTLRSTSKRIIAEKAAQLQKRSWLVAAASGVAGMVPVPGLSVMVDTAILCGELAFYKKVYGLDDEGLSQLSESANVRRDIIVDSIKENFWMNLTAGTLLKAFGAAGIGMAAEEGSKFLPIPILSSLIGGALSFIATKSFLQSTIASMERAALTVLSTALSHASSRRI